MSWRVNRNKLLHREVGVLIADHNGGIGRKSFVIFFNSHDVVVTSHGPVGTEEAVFTEVNWRLVAQSFKQGPVVVRLIERWIGNVDVIQWDRVRILLQDRTHC